MMGGYPYSGKTEFVKRLIPLLDKFEVLHIDLRDWFLPNYKELSENQKRENGFAAWELSIEALDNALWDRKRDDIIIYDTAAASLGPMLERVKIAKGGRHLTYYIVISATAKECEKRAGDEWIGSESIKYYFERYKKTIPTLKQESDKFFIVDNHGPIEALTEQAEKIAEEIVKDAGSRVYQSQ
jgi:predicted kinase